MPGGESRAEYIALPSEAPEQLYLEDGDVILHSRRPSVFDSRLFYWACLGAICSSLLSMSLFIMGSFPTRPTARAHRTADRPRRISTYMNLDKVHRKNASEKFNPIDSFAYVVLQLKNDDPERKVYEDDRMYYSREGAIYPDDRHFLVNEETSTIMQFRNMDYQMERCEVQGLVPPSDMPHDPAADIDYSGKIDVWLLENSRELSRYVLWDRAPKRVKKLTTFQFPHNSEQSTIVKSFHCPSPRFSTFEFVCSQETPNCKVDFWWVKKTPLNGVWIKQFDSYGENR